MVLKRTNGLTTPVAYTLPNSTASLAELPEGRRLIFEQDESYSLGFSKQGPFNSAVLRVVYSSLVTPDSTYDISLVTGSHTRFT